MPKIAKNKKWFILIKNWLFINLTNGHIKFNNIKNFDEFVCKHS